MRFGIFDRLTVASLLSDLCDCCLFLLAITVVVVLASFHCFVELATAGQYTATAMAVAVTPLAVMSLPRLLPLEV